MPPHQPHRSFFKHDMTPLAVERDQRKKAKDASLLAAYAVVNQRDGNRCRVTGIALDPSAIDQKHRREHHHIVKRSQSKAKRDDPSNIMLTSRFVHRLIEKGWIDVEGTDADKPLRFHYTQLATSRPVVIKSRRRSQRRSDAA